VAGRRVLDSGQLTTIDLEQVIRKAGQWQGRLSGLTRILHEGGRLDDNS